MGSDDHIFANSYDPNASTKDAETIIRQNGGLPCGLFVNSTFAFESILRQFSRYYGAPERKKMIPEAFRIIETSRTSAKITMIKPTLIRP